MQDDRCAGGHGVNDPEQEFPQDEPHDNGERNDRDDERISPKAQR